MKWRNHKIVTLCAVYSITGGVVPAAAAMFGSVLPDVMELRYGDQSEGVLQHRTVTHYPPFWAAVCLSIWFLYRHGGYSSWSLYFAFFLVVGGIFHLAEDALSVGGIPLKTPYGKAHGAGFYRVGTFSEEALAFGCVFSFICISSIRGYFKNEHVCEQATLLVKALKSAVS